MAGSVFALVGVINAINMIDGVDGLAASLLAQIFVWYGVLSWGQLLLKSWLFSLFCRGANHLFAL